MDSRFRGNDDEEKVIRSPRVFHRQLQSAKEIRSGCGGRIGFECPWSGLFRHRDPNDKNQRGCIRQSSYLYLLVNPLKINIL